MLMYIHNMKKNPESFPNNLIRPMIAGTFVLSSFMPVSKSVDQLEGSSAPLHIDGVGLVASGPGSGEPNGTKLLPYQKPLEVSQSFEKDILEMEIPPSASSFMNANTVYISSIGCSGTIIRSGNQISGKPVGIAFAKHCGFIPYVPKTVPWTAANYITGSNNKDYTVKYEVIAETGRTINALSSIGEIKQVIVPENDNNKNDQAFGILPGATAQEVLDSYKAESLTETEIHKKLIPGKTVIYMRGWPANQGKGNQGYEHSQEFAMVYLGLGSGLVEDGENLQYVMAAIPKVDTKVDNAVCSFGNSGAGGFVMDGDKAKQIGPLSLFWGLTPLVGYVDKSIYNNSVAPEENRQYFEQIYPKINWNNYSAVCGFAYKKINKHKVVDIVPAKGDIPGQFNSSEYTIYKMQENFSDPNYVKDVVDGTVVISQNIGSKEGGGSGYLSQIVIKRPIIDVDPKSGHVFIGCYEGQGIVNVIEISNLDELEFFQNAWDQPLSLVRSSGEVKYVNDFKQDKVTLVDKNGVDFAEPTYSLPKSDLNPYKIEIKNGHISFKPDHLAQLPKFMTQPNFHN